MKRFSSAQVKQFLQQTFLIGLFISLSVYAWVRMLFFEVPFTVKEDVLNVMEIVMTGWVLIVLLKLAFYSVLGLAARIQQFSLLPLVKLKRPSLPSIRFSLKWVRQFLSSTASAVNS